jgi:hypothetical protein
MWASGFDGRMSSENKIKCIFCKWVKQEQPEYQKIEGKRLLNPNPFKERRLSGSP